MNSDIDKQFADRIKDIKAYVCKEFEIINTISDWKFQMICTFSLLDSFAQARDNYSDNNRECFCRFVSEYSRSFEYWNTIDPITLYYKNYSKFEDWNPLSGMIECTVYHCSEIESIRNSIFSSSIELNNKQHHTYVELLYKLRCKLVHEMETPHGLMGDKRLDEKEPFYSSYEVLGDKWGETWALTFPCDFIKSTVSECINNYINECAENGVDPFENCDPYRDMYVMWSK